MQFLLIEGDDEKIFLLHREDLPGLPVCVTYTEDEKSIFIEYDDGTRQEAIAQVNRENEDVLRKTEKIAIIKVKQDLRDGFQGPFDAEGGFVVLFITM